MKVCPQKAVISMALCSLTLITQAAPIKWTLTNVMLHDGGAISGSFVYDEDTQTFSQISISNTAGSVGTAGPLSEPCSGAWCPPTGSGILFFADSPPATDMTGIKILVMATTGGLTNAGGTVPITGGSTGTCNTSTCATPPPDAQNITSGTLIGVPYLVPQTITFTSSVPVSAVTGGTYQVTATGGASGNPVTFSVAASSASVCSIIGSTVTFNAAGTCVVSADQAGNASFEPAPQATQSFSIVSVPSTPARPVPTMGQWGLAGLTALIAGFALRTNRRRSESHRV